MTPSPPAPSPTEVPATASPAFRELIAMLELYSRETLQQGGSAVLIHLKVGDQEWSHAAGVRTREGGAAVQLSDPVHVGGLTQTMVAVSVLKLVDEGKLVLDDPVSRYVPEIDGLLRPAGQLSVRQLLGHTSGLPDYYGPLIGAGPARQVLTTPVSPQQRLALARTLPLPLGGQQGFNFSRSNYVLLGILVERLRGRPLADVLKADIVEPLSLTATALVGADPPPADLVHGYLVPAAGDGEPMDVAYPAMLRDSAADGMVSTVQETNTFHAALLRGELVSPASLIAMKGSAYSEYGLGLDNWNDRCTNGSYHGESGEVPGYGSVSMSSADGKRQLTISVALPPQPLSAVPSAAVLEMTGLAQLALNAGCRFQFR
ncbi:serine hydrolase domain-containing protein [Paenarthrobacter sp. NPDC092416]|uniref:serine hydrolase domain-containing protein n=1 Tax=Paenarthrobacter sp. NPDC092416 TaxID=3364386 RepID=UPI00382655D6